MAEDQRLHLRATSTMPCSISPRISPHPAALFYPALPAWLGLTI
jgi:hypothetical protein